MKTLSLVTALIFAFPFVLKADEKTMKILDKGYMSALDKDYKSAVDKVFPIYDSLQLNTVEEIVLAHQILCISFCEMGNRDKTVEHYKALKAFSPNEDLQVFNPSSNCQKIIKSAIPSKKK